MPEKNHVLVVNVPFYGHLTPLLELSRKIGKDHHVTFAISKKMAADLRDRELKHIPSDQDITLVEIDDGFTEGFDQNMKALFDNLKNVIFPGAAKFLQNIVKNKGVVDNAKTSNPVDIVIFDVFLTKEAMENRLPGALCYSFHSPPVKTFRWLLLVNEDTPACSMEEHELFHTIPPKGQPVAPQFTGIKEVFVPIARYTPECDGIICSGFESIERDQIDIMRKDFPAMANQKFYFVGPLFPKDTSSDDDNTKKVAIWLETQKPRSVVYVSFGSGAVPEPAQIKEIGNALLATGQPFIWAHRKGHEQHLPEKIRDNIETQFDRKDFLVLPWAPQKAILADPATAVILSHCGWNGALESLTAGVPVVSWPMFADQQIVGGLLVEKGVAVMVPGTGLKPERVVPADEIAEDLKKVGGFGGDSKYYAAAQKWKTESQDAIKPGGLADQDLKKLLNASPNKQELPKMSDKYKMGYG